MAARPGPKAKVIESKYSVEEVCDVLTRFGGLVYIRPQGSWGGNGGDGI